ncbi:uncharacterized protein SOCE26_026790 [Sorangium cellulosum]|uniref:Protein kinase domain-containing protein n=1 Tax=Sorangium cellulosum TaxID=56 RepID=A0A2L0EPP3_SORCE|nr:uncharacterized protein SOCE26_026790 [Sorangium cellulosum]
MSGRRLDARCPARCDRAAIHERCRRERFRGAWRSCRRAWTRWIAGQRSRRVMSAEDRCGRPPQTRHPATYVAHGRTEDGRPYLAIEWLTGQDLGQRLARGPLGVGESVALLEQTAGALAATHGRGVVHRDIEPANRRRSSARSLQRGSACVPRITKFVLPASRAWYGSAARSSLCLRPAPVGSRWRRSPPDYGVSTHWRAVRRVRSCASARLW